MTPRRFRTALAMWGHIALALGFWAALGTMAMAQEVEGPPAPAVIEANTPPPARDERWKRWEAAFMVANAADIVTTAVVLRSGRGYEANPLIGKNPSTGKLVAIKAVTASAHYFMVREIAKTDPATARVVAMVSAIAVAGVAAANVRILF